MSAGGGRRPIVAGNWKMNAGAPAEARALAREVRRLCERHRGAAVAVAPPFTAIVPVVETLEGAEVSVAGQDCHWEAKGAFTGAVAPKMLAAAGCRMVIVGHSERRRLFGDTDESVARKTRAAIDAGLVPIACVGETLPEREAGEAKAVTERQLRAALGGLGPAQLADVVLAYEPVWAIGTGRTATAAQAQEIHAHLRAVAAAVGGATFAAGLRILYGGSVTAANAGELAREADVDGCLVGGASLEAEGFSKIVAAVAETRR